MDTHLPTATRPSLLQLVLLAALYFVGAKISLATAVMPDVLVMMWIPNGILLAALFHFHLRRYALLAMLVLAAEVIADYPSFSPPQAMLFGAINLLEASVAYVLLRTWKFNTLFATPNDIAKFLLAGPGISTFITGCLGAIVYRHIEGSTIGFLETARVWWWSDAIGLAIVLPLALSFWPLRQRQVHERIALRWYDVLAILLSIVLFIGFLQAQDATIGEIRIRPAHLFPIAIYSAARFTPRITAIVLGILTVAILYVTHSGQQPYGPLSMSETVLLVQQFLLIMAITALGLAGLLSQLHASRRLLELRIEKRTAELRAANKMLAALAHTDALTGIQNRRALFEHLEREMRQHQRHGRELAVVMFDIDHFKTVNDRFGHAAGDTVLRQFIDSVKQTLRQTDLLARYGGEEFVLIAAETDRTQVLQLIERIREKLRTTTIQVHDQQLRITASFGVTLLLASDMQPEDPLGRADSALYEAKVAGRNRVVFKIDLATAALAVHQN